MRIRIALLILGLASAGLASAQDTGAAAAGGGGSTRSGAATDTTARNAGATTTSGAPPLAEEPKKPKKVWTNEEMGSLGGTISVVGEPDRTESARAAKQDPPASAADRLREKEISAYRDQLRQLQGQIDEADKRIAQLKNFKGENSSAAGGIDPHQGYNMVPVEEQVKGLEAEKKQLKNRVEDVENEARRNGIESGDLR